MRNLYFKIVFVIVAVTTFTSNSLAQDSNYVRRYGNIISLKAFAYNDDFMFENHSTGLNYIPDSHSGFGVGFLFKYFPFDVSLRKEISLFEKENYHRVSTTDMQLRGYNKFFAGDIYIQKYEGFYESLNNRYNLTDNNDLYYNADLSVFQFDMVGKYIFNHEKFSYKAGFTANERQLISQGSLTAGAALYFLKIQSDSLLIKRDPANLKSCNIGINSGYAYNWVLRNVGTIFASGSLGLNASNLLFRKRKQGFDDIVLSPVFHFKAAYWRNYEKWSFGLTTTFNYIHHTLDEDMTLYVSTRRSELMVIRRF